MDQNWQESEWEGHLRFRHIHDISSCIHLKKHFKASDELKPRGILNLDFDTKFEIIRAPVKKESEDDDRLGDI